MDKDPTVMTHTQSLYTLNVYLGSCDFIKAIPSAIREEAFNVENLPELITLHRDHCERAIVACQAAGWRDMAEMLSTERDVYTHRIQTLRDMLRIARRPKSH